jgi:hypothetical protein
MAADLRPEPTEEEFRAWLPALKLSEVLADLGVQASVNEVLRRLSAGRTEGRTIRNDERSVIPSNWWDEVNYIKPYNAEFWHTGGVTFHQRMGHSAHDTKRAFNYFDVRFEPSGIYAIPGARQPQSQDTTLIGIGPPPSNRGRKPWPHWEAVWAEMVARAMAGEFSASSQADVERVMLEAAEQHPDAPNESTIRLRVQGIWKARKKG